MMNPVKVQSLDSLKALRAALCRFIDAAQVVLSESEGELQRTLNWLETEADSYWQGQIRSRHDAVVKAKDALRAKKLFHPNGFRPSVVDEEKAARLAISRLEEAHAKLAGVHRYAVVLNKEIMQYKGQAQRFANAVAIDIPIAVGKLDALIRHLEAYVALKPVEAGEGAGTIALGPGDQGEVADERLPSMTRTAGGTGFGVQNPEKEAGARDQERAEGEKHGGRGRASGKPGEGGEAGEIQNMPSDSRHPEAGVDHGSL